MATREGIQKWCEATVARVPHAGYCTGPNRFGTSCYDCSGFTYQAYKSQGLTIPADSSLVAKWGRTNNQVHTVQMAKLSDLVVHDKFGDVYASSGPRGHIGIFVRLSGSRVITYESAGSGQGVGVYSRPSSFWNVSVQHPIFAGGAPGPLPEPVPVPILEDLDMPIIVRGGVSPDVFITDGMTKRWLENDTVVHGWTDPKPNIVTQGDNNGPVRIAQQAIDQVPYQKGTRKPDGTVA